jgi:hypothetical protein
VSQVVRLGDTQETDLWRAVAVRHV